jgi:hypothetical protein
MGQVCRLLARRQDARVSFRRRDNTALGRRHWGIQTDIPRQRSAADANSITFRLAVRSSMYESEIDPATAPIVVRDFNTILKRAAFEYQDEITHK